MREMSLGHVVAFSADQVFPGDNYQWSWLLNSLKSKNWAWYHDNITLMDKMAGEVLDRLQQDGLADDTLVVFWSDHGMGMPRGTGMP